MKSTRWIIEENGGHALYFTPYYEEIQVAYIWQDEAGDWLYASSETRDDNKYLDYAGDVDSAKREAERIVEEYYTDQRNYYDEVLRTFVDGLKEG